MPLGVNHVILGLDVDIPHHLGGKNAALAGIFRGWLSMIEKDRLSKATRQRGRCEHDLA